MKIALFLLVLSTTSSYCQVNWKYKANRISPGVYELHLIATVDKPWHIYSQNSPEGGPLPTRIVFDSSSSLVYEGVPKEKGRLIQKFEEVFAIDVEYYDSNITFIQLVKLKSDVDKRAKGEIEYMVCTGAECLPPQKVKFEISLE